ncbi:MAG: AMIN domain-containing protein [Terriglobales bacterium]
MSKTTSITARFHIALCCASICICATEISAQPSPAAVPASTSSATIGNIDVHPSATGLTIAVTASAPVVPTSSRASNPDRLIFDFHGCELKGANRHIPVNRGPVKELRASLFSAHPAVTRLVVDSTEPLTFNLKPAANGIVIIEIPFADPSSASTSPTNKPPEKNSAAPSAPPQSQLPPPNLEPGQKPASLLDSPKPPEPKPARRSSTAAPGAYKLMEKAKALTVEDLQPLEEKAQAGDPESQTLLALAYHIGGLLKKDDAEATQLLQKASARGYMAAEESLGIFAETGIGLDQPAPADALNWYRKAAQQGSLDAETDIALLYANGKGVPRDPAQAVVWFRRAAEGGDASAQYNLALMYERGEGLPRDYREAVRWFTAAADQNLIPPLLALAEISLQPPSPALPNDVNKAVDYYQRAANLGSAAAEVALGTIYSKGMQGKVDYAQAVGWYTKAAQQGEPDGEFALGVSYALGHGVPIDYTQARRWLAAGASQGQVEAQYDLAIICEQGNGAPPDRDQAAHYYQMASDQGMAKAQYRYGLMLAKGSTGSDRIAAYKWLTLAQNSIKESSPALNDLKKSMNAQEIVQGEQDVRNWRSDHQRGKR